MTLTETDRLVRRLRDALKSAAELPADGTGGTPTPPPVDTAALAKPAQDFADACAGASRRLEQCAAMLDVGDEQQAIQLAESDPPVLDLLTRLAFAESRDWREFCRSRGLPVPPEFEARLVGRLNELYAKGITAQHPLYRDYRAAVLRHRPEEAAATLRAIVRLNPADTNAKEELTRLEERRLVDALKELEKTLAAGDQRAAVARVDALEDQARAAGLTPKGSAWEAGLARRRDEWRREALAECRALLPGLEALKAAGKWQAAGPTLAHARSLQTEHGFELEPADAVRLSTVRTWADEQAAAHARELAFTGAIKELEHAVETSEGRAGRVPLPALRLELAGLLARWRDAEEFGRALPDGLEIRHRKRIGLVRLEIEGAQRRRVLTITASAVAVAGVLAAGAFFIVQHQKGMDLAMQIERLITGRQVGAAERLVAEARAREPQRFEEAAVKAAAARAGVMAEEERGRQRDAAARLDALEALAGETTPGPFASKPLNETDDLVDDAGRVVERLAPDFQPAAKARMAAVRNRWEAFLATENAARTERFAADLAKLEKRATDALDYRRPVEELRRSLGELSAASAPMDGPAHTPPVRALRLRDDLATRFDGVQTRVTAFGRELAKYDAGRAAMARAATFPEYLAAVRAGADSEPGRASRELAPAKRLLALNPTPDAVLVAALMPDDADGWRFFNVNADAGFVPNSAVLDPERRIYDSLLVDSNIRNVFKYQTAPPGGSKPGPLFSRGKLDGETIIVGGWRKGVQGTFYNARQFPMAINWEEGTVNDFVTPDGVPASDSQAFLDLRFRDLIDTGSERFTSGLSAAPLHDFLDRLTRNSKASGLFKAFVFDQVCAMMQVGGRSGYFGWEFSPALRQHAREIERIGPHRSGDWLVPDKLKRLDGEFDALFARAAKISYANQARLLAAATREALGAGLNFQGYVTAAGEPLLAGGAPDAGTATPPPDLWGWEGRSGQPARLFRWSTKDRAYRASAPGVEPLPLSPLVAFGMDGRDLLRTAAKRLNVKDEELRAASDTLPPLFRD